MPTTSTCRVAREEARKLWNAHPCGGLPASIHDSDYFDRVEAERYKQQYWQHDFFDFASFAGKRVLEIGVGHGTDMKQFARAGAECFGLDLAETHLRLCRINMEGEGFSPSLHQGDAARIPFPDGYFDCVYSFGVLHHVPDADLVLAEIRRVLKPGGELLTAVYHRWSLASLTLFLRAILDRSIFRLGVAGVLASIERGNGKPYVKLYSRRGWRRLVEQAGFAAARIAVRQVTFHGTKALNRLRPAEGLLGWYVAGCFVKRH